MSSHVSRGEGTMKARMFYSMLTMLGAAALLPAACARRAVTTALAAIKENIPCVEIIEAENVPEEAGATSTMENMIQQGATMIIATAFNHQYPALELANKYPDVIFEHAGGWEMGPTFAN